MYLIDEASGFPRSLLDAAEGNLAGSGKMVLTGNPTRPSGPFYDCWHGKRSLWEVVHIDSRESPNITGREPAVPGLAFPGWLQRMSDPKNGGTEGPVFQVRVAGNFPTAGEFVVIPVHLVEECVARYPHTVAGEAPLIYGLDVGRFGDDPSDLRGRRGNRLLPRRQWGKLDGGDLAGKVLACVRQDRRDATEKPRVNVDVIGVGTAAYEALKLPSLVRDGITYRPAEECRAVPINVSSAPTSHPAAGMPGFSKMRDQLWFAGRDWLSAGGAFAPGDPEFEAELVAPHYSFDARGNYVVESKDDIKKRLGRSPNGADGYNLCCYEGPGTGGEAASLAGWDFPTRTLRTGI